MKGLILKDWRLMARQAKLMLLFIIVFIGIFSFTSPENNFITGVYTMVMVMLTINCFAYDELNHFDRLAASAPLPRSKIVLSRYLSALLTGVTGTGLILALQCGLLFFKEMGTEVLLQNAILIVTSFGVSLLLMAITFPLFYKFGVNKSRLIMIVIFLIPTMLILLISELFLDGKLVLPALSPWFWNTLPILLAAILVLALLLSYSISVKIYQNKEF